MKQRRVLVSMFVCFFAISLRGKTKNPKSRYGVVDMQQVILSVEEGVNAGKSLKSDFKSREKIIIKKRERIERLNKEWIQQAPLLSESARLEKHTEFKKESDNLRKMGQEVEMEFRRRQQEATQKILQKLAPLVKDIAEKQHLEFVFDTISSGLLYVKNPVNLTNFLIKIYNRKYPVNTTSQSRNTEKK